MSSFFHKLGVVLGPVVTLLPILHAIPGAGTVASVAITVAGSLVTLVSTLEKAFPPRAQ